MFLEKLQNFQFIDMAVSVSFKAARWFKLSNIIKNLTCGKNIFTSVIWFTIF